MTNQSEQHSTTPFAVVNPNGASPVLLVCEHASNHIPAAYGQLGLSDLALESHVAWDLGALPMARAMAEHLNARLIFGQVSRLIYDCNRPPTAPDAIPHTTEIGEIPGNMGISQALAAERAAQVYQPFRDAIATAMARQPNTVFVTIHSFTPVFDGHARDVEIGILHDTDTRLADAMLNAAAGSPHKVRRNEPYGPNDGVTHTLKEHALPSGHLNVMIEVRSDLIATEAQQSDMAKQLAGWITKALAITGVPGCTV